MHRINYCKVLNPGYTPVWSSFSARKHVCCCTVFIRTWWHFHLNNKIDFTLDLIFLPTGHRLANMLLARVAHFNDVFDLCLITSCFAVRPKGQRWKKKQLTHLKKWFTNSECETGTHRRRLRRVFGRCGDTERRNALQNPASSLPFSHISTREKQAPACAMAAFSTKATSVSYKGSLLSPPSPFDKLRSYHYWHRSQIRVELRPSQRNCSAKESVFFFSSFFHLSALFSGETPVFLPVMTPVEDRSIIYISERGKNPKVEEWRDGGRRRTHRSLHGCCRLRRWSGISSGIRCLLFFFSQA